MIGNAPNPRNFIVRVDVDGQDGSAVAGLQAADFTVQLRKASGGPLLPATIINALYVQDDYWLLVQPPDDGDGAEIRGFPLPALSTELGDESRAGDVDVDVILCGGRIAPMPDPVLKRS